MVLTVEVVTASQEWVVVTTISNNNKCKRKWQCRVKLWPVIRVCKEMLELTKWQTKLYIRTMLMQVEIYIAAVTVVMVVTVERLSRQ